MNEPEPYEIDLTPDLLDFAKRSAIKEAKKQSPGFVKYDDVAQEVCLKLLSKPPKFDPSQGTVEKTLLYLVVQRLVIKFLERAKNHAESLRQVVKPRTGPDDDREEALEAFSLREVGKRRPAELTTKSATTDDVLEFIDDKESRALCRLVIECDGNVSEAGRRIGLSEGAVRYRLRLLAPKLRAAGFDPFPQELLTKIRRKL